MPRYIDAELLESKYREGTDPQDPYSEIAYLLPEDVESIPTADVEPVRHGQWIECDYKRLEHGFIETYPNAGYCCSVCRTAFEKKKMTYKQYCTKCGAEMSGGEQE